MVFHTTIVNKIIDISNIIDNFEFMLIIIMLTTWNTLKSIKYRIKKLKLFENMNDCNHESREPSQDCMVTGESLEPLN